MWTHRSRGGIKRSNKIDATKEITKVMFVFFLYSHKNAKKRGGAALDTVSI